MEGKCALRVQPVEFPDSVTGGKRCVYLAHCVSARFACRLIFTSQSLKDLVWVFFLLVYTLIFPSLFQFQRRHFSEINLLNILRLLCLWQNIVNCADS